MFATGVFLYSLIIFPTAAFAAAVPVGGSSAGSAPCPTFSTAHIYCTLAPISGFVDPRITIETGGLGKYLNQIVKILVALAGALAVIMIIYGGVQYMLTDSVYGKDAGKKTITNALEGLLLALTAFIILNTINPALLSTQLNSLKPITNLTSVNGGGGVGSINGTEQALTLQTGQNVPGAGQDALSQTILGRGSSQGSTNAERIYNAALAASDSGLQTCNVAGTNGGRLGCAWAVNNIVDAATGINLTNSLSTRDLNSSLLRNPNFVLVGSDFSQSRKGDIVVSPTLTESNPGHTGIVTADGGGRIISNSSSQGQVMENYTGSSWTDRYGTKKNLEIFIYRAVDGSNSNSNSSFGIQTGVTP